MEGGAVGIVCALLLLSATLELAAASVVDPCCGGLHMDEVCQYSVEWTVKGDEITFEVRAQTTGWVAIGFSNNRFMVNSDIIVGAADSTSYFVEDRFATARNQSLLDASQDISNVTAMVASGGNMTMRFTRPRNSGDSNDISLDECRFLLFACGGNFTIGSPNTIGYHGYGAHRRAATQEKICFPSPQTCPAPTPFPTPSPSLSPSSSRSPSPSPSSSPSPSPSPSSSPSPSPSPSSSPSPSPSPSPLDCGTLQSANGTVTYNTTGALTSGTVATYSCEDGYELVGEETRICLVDGTCTGTEPECEVTPGLSTEPQSASLLGLAIGITILVSVVIAMAIAVIVLVYMWKCRGVCKAESKIRREQDGIEMSENISYGPVKQNTISSSGGSTAVPEYEEIQDIHLRGVEDGCSP